MKMKPNVLAAACGIAIAGWVVAQEAKETKAVQPHSHDHAGHTHSKEAPTEVKTTAVATPFQATKAAPPPVRPAPPWSDAEFAMVGDLLKGSWKTTKSVAQGDSAADKTDVVLSIAHVAVEGLPDCLYVEAARSDAMNKPFRQAIWQLYKNKGKSRLRTFEFRRADGEMFSVVGLWGAPEMFPGEITMKDLVGTLDLELTVSGGTVKGKTPYAYPTGRGGAVEMTSEFTATKDSLETSDRGLGVDGSSVWGGDKYTFARFTPTIKFTKSDDGLLVIDYGRAASGGDVITNGCRVAVAYTGTLTNGRIFDTTRDLKAPFQFTFGEKPIPAGVARTLEGARQGDLRRAVVPSSLAFGVNGNVQAGIPGGATVVYELEVLAVEGPAPMNPTNVTGNVKVTPLTEPPPFIKEKMEEQMKLQQQKDAESPKNPPK